MNRSIIKIVTIIFIIIFNTDLSAQSYTWSTTSEGIYRDGKAFFLNGQSWAKKTAITYNQGSNAENQVKKTLNYLNSIGVNTIRIYGSPDDSDWDGSANFHNLIK